MFLLICFFHSPPLLPPFSSLLACLVTSQLSSSHFIPPSGRQQRRILPSPVLPRPIRMCFRSLDLSLSMLTLFHPPPLGISASLEQTSVRRGSSTELSFLARASVTLSVFPRSSLGTKEYHTIVDPSQLEDGRKAIESQSIQSVSSSLIFSPILSIFGQSQPGNAVLASYCSIFSPATPNQQPSFTRPFILLHPCNFIFLHF